MRFYVYTGPTLVQHVATVLRAAGYTDIHEGTQKVYGTVDSTNELQATLDQQFGRSAGYRVGTF